MPDKKKNKNQYDCNKCPAYCCSYPRIVVTDSDLRRLAEHFGTTEKEAEKRHTRQYRFDDGKEKISERILRHEKDQIYKSVCGFLDQTTRRCTIYDARPSVCREFPNGTTCGYYQFLKFERKQQGDKTFIPSA
ncbi:MAG: YkgJ family cysteine cluster protein [Betaproteobacteria bacterium]|jgi:Fe-S-cluster containining protein|nr:YkgJ family cysteine cluster protein [Betaproteobacteria bacterium]